MSNLVILLIILVLRFAHIFFLFLHFVIVRTMIVDEFDTRLTSFLDPTFFDLLSHRTLLFDLFGGNPHIEATNNGGGRERG